MELDYAHNWNVQFKKSVLPYAILCILSQRKCYGYLLISILEENLEIEIADGTVYMLLSRFEKLGYICSNWEMRDVGSPRKFYVITDSGQLCLNKISMIWNLTHVGLSNLNNNNYVQE